MHAKTLKLLFAAALAALLTSCIDVTAAENDACDQGKQDEHQVVPGLI